MKDENPAALKKQGAGSEERGAKRPEVTDQGVRFQIPKSELSVQSVVKFLGTFGAIVEIRSLPAVIFMEAGNQRFSGII